MPAPLRRPLLPGDPLGRLRLALTVATWPCVVAATALAVAPLISAFAGGTLAELVVGAALVSVAVAAGLGFAGWAATWASLASLGCYLLYTLVAVLRDPLGVGDLARGLTSGGAHLLSVTLPVDQPRWLMVLPVTLCWMVGALATELLVRRRSVGAAIVPWLVGFAVSLALTAGAPDRSIGSAVALVAVVGGLVCCRRWLATASLAPAPVGGSGVAGFEDGDTEGSGAHGASPRTRPWPRWPGMARSADAVPLRPLVLGAATLMLAVTVGALVVPRIPGLDGLPVAPSRRPPVRLERPITPTDAVAALREDDPTAPPTAELTVRSDRPFDGYVGLAVLDDYDGDTWSFDRTFVPTGGRVPAPLGAPIGGVTVVEHIHLLRTLPFPWMPTAGRVTAVRGIAVDYAPTSGMVVPATALHAGSRYEVVSQNPVVTLDSLGAAGLARSLGGSPDPADLSVPEPVQPYMGAVVDALAKETGVTPAPTLRFLAAVEADFQQHYARIDPAAAAAKPASGTVASVAVGVDEGGTSFADVVHAVMTSRQATPEQYATLFALVARSEGIPARLVTGFRIAPLGAGAGAVGGRGPEVVTNRQAWTWVEVPVDGLGWLVADPAPLAVTTPALPVVSAGSKPVTPSPSATAVATGSSGHALASPVRIVPTSPAPWWPWAIGVVAAAAVLGVAVPLSAWVRRRRRRARRRHGNPSQRVLGAWQEVLDTLVEHDCGGLRPLTASEVAARARVRFSPEAGEQVASVGAMADRVLFSSHGAVADDAVQAWQATVVLEKVCHRQLSHRQRLRVLTRVAEPTRG